MVEKAKETTQVNIKSIPVDVLEKIQYIAVIEKVSYTEIYNKAFSTFIELYEKKYGKLKPKPKGKGLDLL